MLRWEGRDDADVVVLCRNDPHHINQHGHLSLTRYWKSKSEWDFESDRLVRNSKSYPFPANRSRSFIFQNFPVDVRGIASRNS